MKKEKFIYGSEEHDNWVHQRLLENGLRISEVLMAIEDLTESIYVSPKEDADKDQMFNDLATIYKLVHNLSSKCCRANVKYIVEGSRHSWVEEITS